jgi:DNA-binding NtrC family response regulator
VTRAVVPRILIVDDETFILRLAERLLSGDGCDVLTATGGRDALATVEQRGQDLALVLTDVVMPDLDGIAVARARMAAVPPIPVLLMSGFTDANTAGLPLIEKPFTPTTLIDRVREVLGALKKLPRREEQRTTEEERRTG